MRKDTPQMEDRGDQAADNNPASRVNQLWTCAEMRQKLPHVLQFYEIFKLFVRPASSETLDILKVSECLRAMGIDFEESTLKACLVRRLLCNQEGKPPKHASFELVLSLYCELANSSCDTPSLALMIKGLSCQDIGSQKGQLPYGVLRRMLTTMGDRLNESEVKTLLDSLKDDSGNVDYVALLETLFTVDSQAAEKLKQARTYVQAFGKNFGYVDMQKRDEFIRALRRLDTNNTGFGTPLDCMLYLLNPSGESLTPAELADLTRDAINMKQ